MNDGPTSKQGAKLARLSKWSHVRVFEILCLLRVILFFEQRRIKKKVPKPVQMNILVIVENNLPGLGFDFDCEFGKLDFSYSI